jgi:hypothetical protein
MPSLFEGYGMVLTEALARGSADPVHDRRGRRRDAPDAAAFKVPPGDIAALPRR